MSGKIAYCQTFREADFFGQRPGLQEYDQCRFISCNFAEADLSEVKFIECQFEQCDLSMARLNRTALQQVEFLQCKLMGLRFDHCNDFLLAFSFRTCKLNYASFFQIKMPETRFEDCQLAEVDFAEADLFGAVFSDCDLRGATFDRTVLEKADLRTAVHYALDPENNRIKGARFSVQGLPGLLGKYGIEVDENNF